MRDLEPSSCTYYENEALHFNSSRRGMAYDRIDAVDWQSCRAACCSDPPCRAWEFNGNAAWPQTVVSACALFGDAHGTALFVNVVTGSFVTRRAAGLPQASISASGPWVAHFVIFILVVLCLCCRLLAVGRSRRQMRVAIARRLGWRRTLREVVKPFDRGATSDGSPYVPSGSCCVSAVRLAPSP